MFKRCWVCLVLLLFAASIMSLSVVEGSEDISNGGLYHSESNRLQYVIESGFPTDENEIVFNWQYTPMNTKTSNSATTWTITSTPLIVGEYVFIACGDTIYKLEASSGACVGKAERQFERPTFYHYLGYGDGTIVDYNAGELFDLDLNKIGQIESLKACWCEDGAFYGIFKENKSFKLRPFTLQGDASGRHAEYGGWTADVTGWFRMYGHISSPVITGTHLYYLSATDQSGKPEKVFLNSVDRGTGAKTTLDLELDQRYLDDGWLTYHENTIYLPTYGKGLFDSDDGEGSSVTAIAIDGTGGMQKAFSYTFPEVGITSNFVIHNGRGYINVCSKFVMEGGARASFYVFDMDTFGEGCQPVYRVPSAYTHGGIVLNKNYESDDGNVYIYFVPYDDGAIPRSPYLYMINDNPGKTSSVLQKFTLASRGNSGGYNYSSQTVRATADGSLVWYRDLGQVVCFTGIQQKTYHVLLEKGDMAKWVDLTEQQLRGIGNSDIAVVDKEIVSYNLGGETIEDFRMYYYKDGDGWSLARDANLGNDAGGAYSQINTLGGCTINYLILTDGDTPDENSVFNTEDGRRMVLGSYLEDKDLTGVMMIRGGPDTPVGESDYAIDVDVSNSATDTLMEVTVSLAEGSEPLNDARLLVVSTYEGGFSHNVCPAIGPFVDGKTTERIAMSNQDLLTVSIEVVDGFPENTYANHGQYLYVSGDTHSFDADHAISCDELQNEVYEFICGQDYRVDFYSDSMMAALHAFRALDGSGCEIDNVLISVANVEIIKGRLSDGYYHIHAVLTVTGESVESCVFSNGSIQFNAKVIGEDPEPPVPEEPDFVYSDRIGAEKYDYESGRSYRVEFKTTNPSTLTPLRDPKVMGFNEVDESQWWPDGYEFTFTDLVMAGVGDDGYNHVYFTISVTGPSLDDCYIVFNEGIYMFRAEIIGEDPEPPVPDHVVIDGASNETVYEFVSGQTYLVDYISPRPRQASEFENLWVSVLDFMAGMTVLDEYTVTVADLNIPDEPESDGYHMTFNLTITGPSLGPYDFAVDYKYSMVSNSNDPYVGSTFRMLITVIGEDPEPPVPDHVVIDGASNETVYEFVSGQTYLVDYISPRPRQASEFENLWVSIVYIMMGKAVVLDDYTVTVADLNVPDEPESDGYHIRFCLTITGPPLGPFDYTTDYKYSMVSNSNDPDHGPSVMMRITVIGEDQEP